MKKEILRLDCVSKTINDTKVLKNISLNIYEGEIIKLFGDEGQSKSLLVRLLNGEMRPDFGKIYVNGNDVEITSPSVGKRIGISIINKKSDLVPNLTVMENLFLGKKDFGSRLFINKKKQLARTKELLRILGLDILPDMRVDRLETEQIQLVQLGKALLDDPKIVVMDHTHILLDEKQITLFAGVFKELSRRKVGVLVVAQNLKDFASVCDRVYIMKHGNIIGNVNKSNLEKEKIVKIITEDYIVNESAVSLNNISKEVMRVENLSTKNSLYDVNFSVKKGEIVSITGSYGSGKCDIGHALVGLEKITGGKIYLDNKPVRIRNVDDALKNKISFISYEKEENGLLRNLSVKENITISRLNDIDRMGIIRKELEDWLYSTVTADLGFEFGDGDLSVDQLSIADQRKVSIARALSCNPKVLILVDVTKGLNNINRKQVLELLISFANRGLSIILISSNVYEILQVSNRILFYGEHTITGEINNNKLKYGAFI